MNETQLGIKGKAWNDHELDLIVKRYLELYVRIANGESIVKEHEYRELSEELRIRSTSSVALKMSNISSVMLGLGWPHIPGLSPMPHIQRALLDHVSNGIASFNKLDEAATQLVNQKPAEFNIEVELEKSIPKILKFNEPLKSDISMRVKRNYIELEARNEKLGLAGELAILEYEEKRLRRLGAIKLANKIDHVSATIGDGLGYDIHSFEANGKDKLIEVKTTTGSNVVPFYITRNELRASQEFSDVYCLSRVYDYPVDRSSRRKVKFYELNGSLEETCDLKSETYRAVPCAR